MLDSYGLRGLVIYHRYFQQAHIRARIHRSCPVYPFHEGPLSAWMKRCRCRDGWSVDSGAQVIGVVRFCHKVHCIREEVEEQCVFSLLALAPYNGFVPQRVPLFSFRLFALMMYAEFHRFSSCIHAVCFSSTSGAASLRAELFSKRPIQVLRVSHSC